MMVKEGEKKKDISFITYVWSNDDNNSQPANILGSLLGHQRKAIGMAFRWLAYSDLLL